MTGEHSRLTELRRRVQADPASLAFAQLAEECRRAGGSEEAVVICRAGLAHHPDYLFARVTLGRALVELDRLDEAEAELRAVLTAAPDNLAASRALAEVFQKRGQTPEALAQYRQALELARVDPPTEAEAPPTVESLFDFDRLIEQLGAGKEPPLAAFRPDSVFAPPVPSVLDAVELQQDDRDPFSVLERQLRDSDEEQLVLTELEDWLAAIALARDPRPNA